MFLDFVLFDCVFSVGPTSQKIGWEVHLRNDLHVFCRVGCKTKTQLLSNI